MPSARPELAATHRDIVGKKVAGLRRDGKLPAVLFGRGVPSANVTLDAHEFEQLRRHAGPNTLIDVSVDGKKPSPVLVHGVQVHMLNRRPVHVDLFLVRMTEELTVDVPLVMTGVSAAVDKLGGTLSHMDSLKVRALPDHLPQSVEVSIDSLEDFDSVIHVRDIAIPGDVTLLSDPDEVAVHVLAPRVVEEEPVIEAVGEGAPEEGEEAATTEEAPEAEAG